MTRALLGLTGSVASIKGPELARLLREAGHQVRVVCTPKALHFVAVDDLVASGAEAFLDQDEWPSRRPYRRGDEVLHIALRSWADVLVVAPLSANALAKFAHGLADDLLSCVFRAWDFSRPVVLAPAMNTFMWEGPMTRRALQALLDAFGAPAAPRDWALDDVEGTFERQAPRFAVLGPVSKRLACGDEGTGAMAEPSRIVEAVNRSRSPRPEG